jgi:hypothetical protein
MSAVLSGLRRVLPAVLLTFAIASGVAACADFNIVPDNAPHSPHFHG